MGLCFGILPVMTAATRAGDYGIALVLLLAIAGLMFAAYRLDPPVEHEIEPLPEPRKFTVRHRVRPEVRAVEHAD